MSVKSFGKRREQKSDLGQQKQTVFVNERLRSGYLATLLNVSTGIYPNGQYPGVVGIKFVG
jgi:hypothetical protein